MPQTEERGRGGNTCPPMSFHQPPCFSQVLLHPPSCPFHAKCTLGDARHVWHFSTPDLAKPSPSYPSGHPRGGMGPTSLAPKTPKARRGRPHIPPLPFHTSFTRHGRLVHSGAPCQTPSHSHQLLVQAYPPPAPHNPLNLSLSTNPWTLGPPTPETIDFHKQCNPLFKKSSPTRGLGVGGGQCGGLAISAKLPTHSHAPRLGRAQPKAGPSGARLGTCKIGPSTSLQKGRPKLGLLRGAVLWAKTA